MALVSTAGLDHFEQGEPLRGLTRLASAGVDYFEQGEPFPVVGAAASGDVVVSASLLTLTATLQAPTVSATRNVTPAPSLLTLTTTLSAPTVSATRTVTPAPSLLTLALSLQAPTIVTVSGTTDALNYFHLGEPLGVKADPATRAFDYFHLGEPLPAVTKASSLPSGAAFAFPVLQSLALTVQTPTVTTTRITTVTPALLTLTTTPQAPTVIPRRSVTVTPARFDLALTLFAPSITVLQIGRPVSDVAAGLWSTNTGAVTNLWDTINEGTPNDADYVRSSASPVTADEYKVRLTPMVDPAVSTGHVIRFRYMKDAPGGDRIDLVVTLYRADGATAITQVGYADIDALTDGVIELSTFNADDIPSVDYATGLVVGFSARVGSGDEGLFESWF